MKRSAQWFRQASQCNCQSPCRCRVMFPCTIFSLLSPARKPGISICTFPGKKLHAYASSSHPYTRTRRMLILTSHYKDTNSHKSQQTLQMVWPCGSALFFLWPCGLACVLSKFFFSLSRDEKTVGHRYMWYLETPGNTTQDSSNGFISSSSI
jgi:hypothetical protein